MCITGFTDPTDRDISIGRGGLSRNTYGTYFHITNKTVSKFSGQFIIIIDIVTDYTSSRDAVVVLGPDLCSKFINSDSLDFDLGSAKATPSMKPRPAVS